jgi:uncharacterized membrane protein YsdA (DUF1294 family)
MTEFLYSPLFLYYLFAVNGLAFILYGIDKYKAVRHQWRIPESTLLLMAVLGGGIGSIMGMKGWRHKTQHLKFRFGVPAIILAQLALLLYVKHQG